MKSRRLEALYLFTALLALIVTSRAAASGAVAPGDTKRVGLVVAFPDGARHAEIVTVPATATTFDVLAAASVKLASQKTQFGPAVCSINGVGCPADNCFCDSKRFWAYFHLDAAAMKWTPAAEGAGAYVPADGAVEGFVWSEADASFAPISQPPVLSFAQIQAAASTGLTRSLAWAVPLALVIAAAVVGAVLYRRRRK